MTGAWRIAARNLRLNRRRNLATGLAVDPDSSAGDGVVERRRSSGSGVILDASGYVMTNYHVVRGAAEIEASLSDG